MFYVILVRHWQALFSFKKCIKDHLRKSKNPKIFWGSIPPDVGALRTCTRGSDKTSFRKHTFLDYILPIYARVTTPAPPFTESWLHLCVCVLGPSSWNPGEQKLVASLLITLTPPLKGPLRVGQSNSACHHQTLF